MMKSVLYVYSKQTRKECIMKKINLYLVLPVMVLLFVFNNSYGQSAEDYFKSGREKYKNKDYKGAIADQTMAIVRKKDCAEAYYNRGLAKARIGDFKGAIADYSMSIELTIIENKKGSSEEQIDETSDSIDIALINDNNRIRGLILSIQYLSRGISKYKLNDFKGAIADYDIAINSDSNHIDAYLERGFIKNKTEDYEGAYKDYDKVIMIDSGYAEAYNGRGYSRSHLSDYEEAMSDYNKAIELDTKNETSYFERAAVRMNLMDMKGSIADYTKAIELNPKFGNAYFARGLIKELINDMKGACEDWHKSVEIGGEDIELVKDMIDKKCE